MATAAPAKTQAPSAEEKLYRVALREALTEEMERDDSIYLIGEDIGKFGGAYRVTEGLLDKFGPQRVVDAPIAEEVIDAEVIDLRAIRPIDWQPIVESVRKTSRCVVVEEGWSTYGVSAEIAAGVQERCFDYLDAPIRRLGGAQVPMPYSLPLEKASIPTSEDIKRMARLIVG